MSTFNLEKQGNIVGKIMESKIRVKNLYYATYWPCDVK